MAGLARALRRGVKRQLGADDPQYGGGLCSVWYAKDHLQNYLVEGTKLRSRKGPDYSSSYAGPMYDDNGNRLGYKQHIPNSEAVGASAGVLPTGWVITNHNGITVSPIMTDDGFPAFRFTGTATATSNPGIAFVSSTTVAAVIGQSWTLSCIAHLINDLLGNIGSVAIYVAIAEYSITPAYLTSGSANNVFGVETSYSRVLINAATSYVRPTLSFTIPNGATIDFTIRISQPQLTQTATKMPYVPTSGTAIDTGAIPVVHHDSAGHIKGIWGGPAYSNRLPTGGEVLTTSGGIGITVVPSGGMYRLSRNDTTTNSYRAIQYFNLVSGTKYVLCIIAKKDTAGSLLGLRIQGSYPNRVDAVFNLDDGTVAFCAGDSAFTEVAASIKRLSVDTYLCEVSVVSTETSALGQVVFGPTTSASNIWEVACPGLPSVFLANPQVTASFAFPYVPPGTSVVSAAGTTGGNGAYATLDARLTEAFRGRTNGVELFNPAGTTNTNCTQTGGVFSRTVAGTAWAFFLGGKLIVGERYRYTISVSGRTAGTCYARAGNTGTGATLSSDGEFVQEILCAGDNIIRWNGTSDFDGTVSLKIQKLLPATCTVAALSCMGVGSGELPLNNYYSITSLTSNADSVLAYGNTGAGTKQIVYSYDGTTVSKKESVDWNRDDLLLRIVQTKTDGSQFRVGYRRYSLDKTPIDSAITWSSWVNFDGSFGPLTYLRWFLNNSLPVWMRAVAIWDKGAIADSEILKRMEAA